MPVRYDPTNRLLNDREALQQATHAVEAFAEQFWKNYEKLARSGCEDPATVDPFLFSRAVLTYTVETFPGHGSPKVGDILSNMRKF